MPMVTSHSWENVYQYGQIENMPWYSAGLDKDIEQALQELEISSGKILDLGTGPGTQAVALAKMGFEVTATDVSETAIAKALKLANIQEAAVVFEVDDILATHLIPFFDVIIDRGVFHSFSLDEHDEYIGNIQRLLDVGGYLLLKCFSDKQPGAVGPYRYSASQIQNIFKTGFKVISISETEFRGPHQPYPKALFCIIQKT
ncbi:MAG: class I SAM-dependent methyltransferase [Candidatus Kerfeldbacteria bacterium CG08_land_8_20_14_0_20_43_14]|uniref:Class I SAM-dependent methyltransferase n=1 Tax=Candidatus Kerfeldbacteria bacterium CG08_land_8_20_14_0_20_43_14 TaxID=2014246 RepID=A0A2H0YQM3_9BACT|nr:MAG: class I SAM-dependent methyltransferase [Candidatus Kerfeldbacteria bacterium CG08_land_8_20_14_0_20_43_14]